MQPCSSKKHEEGKRKSLPSALDNCCRRTENRKLLDPQSELDGSRSGLIESRHGERMILNNFGNSRSSSSPRAARSTSRTSRIGAAEEGCLESRPTTKAIRDKDGAQQRSSAPPSPTTSLDDKEGNGVAADVPGKSPCRHASSCQRKGWLLFPNASADMSGERGSTDNLESGPEMSSRGWSADTGSSQPTAVKRIERLTSNNPLLSRVLSEEISAETTTTLFPFQLRRLTPASSPAHFKKPLSHSQLSDSDKDKGRDKDKLPK